MLTYVLLRSVSQHLLPYSPTKECRLCEKCVLKGILAQYCGDNCILDDSYFIFYTATQMGPGASIYRDFRISSCVVLVEFLIRGSPSKRKNFTGQDVNIQGGSNMTGTDLCVNLATSVPVIFEPPCTSMAGQEFESTMPLCG